MCGALLPALSQRLFANRDLVKGKTLGLLGTHLSPVQQTTEPGVGGWDQGGGADLHPMDQGSATRDHPTTEGLFINLFFIYVFEPCQSGTQMYRLKKSPQERPTNTVKALFHFVSPDTWES